VQKTGSSRGPVRKRTIEQVSVSAATHSRLLPASLSELVVTPNANKIAIEN